MRNDRRRRDVRPARSSAMSIFGAMDTAVSGLTSQGAAFANISDNVANSQTTGFKRVDTSFDDYLTYSSAVTNESGSVVARPDYVNTVQGTITQTDNPLAMAISGQGFFSVSTASTSSTGQPVFSQTPQYTRDGNFTLNSDGYLQNDVGNYLNGWPVNAQGVVSTAILAPIQVNQGSVYPPVPTSNIALSANLPAGGTTTTTSDVSVYDSLGQAHQLTMSFQPSGLNSWNLTVTDDTGATIGTATLNFAADGTLTGGSPVTLNTNYPLAAGGNQTITLNLGGNATNSGLTQFAGSAFAVNGLTQDGLPPGSFTGVSTTASGDVVVNYSNGQSTTVAQIPVTTFAAPDALQRQDGQAFTTTQASGDPLTQAAGAGSAGTLVTSATEASNVDISTEFTNLIVAQQAYSANAKVITTADQMLQAIINIQT
jgi:flagellar hook protein FlgE